MRTRSALAKGGQLDRAMGLFKEMEQCGVRATVITYNCLMSACEHACAFDDAQRVLALAQRDAHVRPNNATFTALVATCEKTGHHKVGVGGGGGMHDASKGEGARRGLRIRRIKSLFEYENTHCGGGSRVRGEGLEIQAKRQVTACVPPG